MAPKIDFTTVEKVLRQNIEEENTVHRILKQLREENQEEEKEKPPRLKRQFVILVSDPEGHIPARDFVGWVVQIPEEDSPATAEERIRRAAYDFNASPRGRKLPVMSIGEACENVTAKFFKEYKVDIKTKIPVQVMISGNELPAEDDTLTIERE